MHKLKHILVLNIFLFLGLCTHAQDLHFSQFFNSPLTTNPANTGFIPDADYRLGVNYRNQWSSILGAPYKTMSAFADAQLFKNKLENSWIGLGGVILSDKAGSGSLKSDKFYGSVAFHQMLGYSSLLSAGFNLGYVSKRIDPTNLKFPDQFNGKFFDGTTPTSVQFNNLNIDYYDMQVGMNYAYFPDENTYINAGYSIHHVNKPKETFFGDNTSNGKIPIRHIGFVNAILKVNPRVIINPNIYFTTQTNAIEINGGLNANYNLSEFGESQLIAGLYYRYKDAIIPMLGLETKKLSVTLNYDITLSKLSKFNNFRGAAEISIVKKGFYPSNVDKQTLCPKF
ncbi:MAG: PorP/SprF family type IX secretion system membrane protein [Ferruginibacter sp.]